MNNLTPLKSMLMKAETIEEIGIIRNELVKEDNHEVNKKAKK